MAALLVFCNIKELHCRHIELHPTPHKTFRIPSTTLHTTMLLTVNVTIRNHSIENTTQGSIAGIADASGPVTGQSTRSCTRDPIAIVGVEQIAVTAVHSTTLVAVHSTQTRVPPFWVNNNNNNNNNNSHVMGVQSWLGRRSSPTGLGLHSAS